MILDFVNKKYNLLKNKFSKNELTAVEIETISICNRKCHYCPNYTVGRLEKIMDENFF